MLLYYILVPLAWVAWHLVFRIQVIGRDNLKKVATPGYIIAPTHISAIDPVFVIITRFWGRRMIVFGKKELFEINPLLSWFFRCMGGVCVRGTREELAVIDDTIAACREGGSLLIFPEGTREREGKLLPPRAASSSLRPRPGWMWCPAASSTTPRTAGPGCSAGCGWSTASRCPPPSSPWRTSGI